VWIEIHSDPPRAMQSRDVKISMTCRSAYPTVAKGIIRGVLTDPIKKAIAYIDFQPDVQSTGTGTAGTMRRIEPTEENCRLGFLVLIHRSRSYSILICFVEMSLSPPRWKLPNFTELESRRADLPAQVSIHQTSQLVTRRGCPLSPSTIFQEFDSLLEVKGFQDGNTCITRRTTQAATRD